MSQLDFETLASYYPDQLSVGMQKRFAAAGNNPKGVGISPDLVLEYDTRICVVKSIGSSCVLGCKVNLREGVQLGNGINVGAYSWIGPGVSIGSLVNVGLYNYFARGSGVLGNPEANRHVYARTTRTNVKVGPNVLLPNEVQLGDDAVIPTSDSIGQIGRFGTTKRMVTAYGSDAGPRYGVGCQFGIDAATFRERISGSTGTLPESAADYASHFSEIEALGTRVQAAYEREANLVSDLRETWQLFQAGYASAPKL